MGGIRNCLKLFWEAKKRKRGGGLAISCALKLKDRHGKDWGQMKKVEYNPKRGPSSCVSYNLEKPLGQISKREKKEARSKEGNRKKSLDGKSEKIRATARGNEHITPQGRVCKGERS